MTGRPRASLSASKPVTATAAESLPLFDIAAGGGSGRYFGSVLRLVTGPGISVTASPMTGNASIENHNARVRLVTALKAFFGGETKKPQLSDCDCRSERPGRLVARSRRRRSRSAVFRSCGDGGHIRHNGAHQGAGDCLTQVKFTVDWFQLGEAHTLSVECHAEGVAKPGDGRIV